MEPLVVKVVVNASIEQVWNSFTEPHHIRGWNFASDDWHCPKADSDLRVGGKFCYTMAAKDGSMQFDFWGHFRVVKPMQSLEFSLGEDLGSSRWVRVDISEMLDGSGVLVEEQFVPEDQNPLEMQQMGWQMILDNFKKYTESSVD